MSAAITPLSRILRNTALLGGGELAGRMLTFFAVLRLSRALQTAGMGAVDFGLTMHGLMFMTSVGGAELLASRRVSRSTRRVGQLAGVTMLSASCVFMVAMLALSLFASFGPGDPVLWRYAPLFALAALPGLLAPRFAFFGREQMATVATTSLAGHLTFLTLVLALVHTPDDLRLVPILWFGAEAVRSGALLVTFLKRFGPIQLRIRPRLVRAWIVGAMPLSMSRLVRNLLLGLDLLLLGVLESAAAVGFYGIALRIPQFLAGATFNAQTAIFPSISRGVTGAGSARLGTFHNLSVALLLALGLPGTLALSAVAAPVLTLLFGDGYTASAIPFRVLMWKVLLVGASGLYRNVVLAGRPGLDARIAPAGVVVAGTAMVLLIPTHGALGAAYGTLLGEATLLVGYAIAGREWVPAIPTLRPLWLLALALGSAVAWLAAHADVAALWVIPLAAAGALGGAAIAAVPVVLSARRELREPAPTPTPTQG